MLCTYCVEQFENVLSFAVSQLRLRDYRLEVLRFDDQIQQTLTYMKK